MLSLKQAAQHHADQAHWYPQCRVVVSLAGRPFRCAPVMTHVELVEVISFVLEDLLAGRPTVGAGSERFALPEESKLGCAVGEDGPVHLHRGSERWSRGRPPLHAGRRVAAHAAMHAGCERP
jgi:hypothetical protein